MFQWVRNSRGRLVKVSLPQEPKAAIISNMNQMEPPPKEQQSQQLVERNLNAYRSIRDYRNPPRMGLPSCMVPPTNAPYGNAYKPSWGNHLNLTWGPKPLQYALPAH